ncbi:TPA: Rgg/GadR/MutR family transcriptional regulator, partial [Streptococcus equi subsp. equi]|nr:Rgg/GadR/MutR family transcriptional regulator [Streptococcus equi subsp. equi]
KSVNNNYFISDDLIEYLKNYLFSMVNWANYELTLFSETIHLFEPNAFLNYCQEMLHRSDFYKRLSYNSAIIQTILINGV